MKFSPILTFVTVCGLAGSAAATDWTLNSDASRLSFGSIKSEEIGESHSFGALSGSVAADGATRIEIGLASVETMIDIRNTRMIEHLFRGAATATLSAQIDLSEMEGTAVGDGMVTYTEATLDLLGTEVPLDFDAYVLRVTEDRVMVMPDGLIFLSTVDAGLDAGVDTLMELAGLESITRSVPVSFRLVFDADDAGS